MSNRGSFGSYEPGYGSYNSGGTGQDSSNDFTRLSQMVSNNVQKIKENGAQMQRLINDLGTSQDSPELRDKLHQVQHYTKQLAKDTNKYLSDLAHVPSPSSQSEQRQSRMQKERLMNEFSSSLNNFQQLQRTAAQKEKDSISRAKAHSGLSYDPFLERKDKDDQLIGLESPPPQQQQVLQMEEDVNLELIREREQAVLKLESDIVDVNQIFKDLGVLVHEQGEMIDSIEAHVESSQIHVEEGTQQLGKARNYQTKSRRKKCIIIIIILVILAIIGLILGLTLKN